MKRSVSIRVPATTANLGPGFDCLGLALDLWNETVFTIEGEGLKIAVRGEGEGQIPVDEENLIYISFCRVYSLLNEEVPVGLQITCHNAIPLSSGLGSSSAAVLTGILGANALLNNPLDDDAVIQIATKIEGHPDNVAPAYYGGLTISIQEGKEVVTQKIAIPDWQVVVVLPDIQLSTEDARLALPESVLIKDAVFNIGHSALVVEALRNGDIDLLLKGMHDKMHQPCRLGLIPGAKEAIQTAQEMGAPAALSGAGPSVVAFGDKDVPEIASAMKMEFRQKGVFSREFRIITSQWGVQII